MTIRVLLVDDDPMVFTALETILGKADDIEVVGQARDGDEVIEAIHRHRPTVVLMDVRMARQDGITTATALSRSSSSMPKVIILTTFEFDEVFERAVHAGVSGFLLKSADPDQIVSAVRSVAQGEGALSPRTARQAVDLLRSDPTAELRRSARALVATLTERELDIARGVARELTNAHIAAELYLGEATVKSHLARAQDKLGVRSRVGVGIIVERAGVLNEPSLGDS